MHFAVEIAPFGEFGDGRAVMRLAQAAEDSGWDGLYIWDHLAYVFGYAGADVWILLSAAAAVTRRIRIGPMITPLPRRRVQVLAQTLVTLDHLSNGRLTFAAGLGGTEQEFAVFGEDPDPKRRAAMLDEGLGVLDRLLRGESVYHRGEHNTVQQVVLQPRPIQQPRLPIWVGGDSPAAQRRAARWDGWAAGGVDMEGKMVHPPEWFAERVKAIHERRPPGAAFNVTVSGCTATGEADLPRAYAEAGATWWLETVFGLRGSVEEMLERVKAGPPK